MGGIKIGGSLGKITEGLKNKTSGGTGFTSALDKTVGETVKAQGEAVKKKTAEDKAKLDEGWARIKRLINSEKLLKSVNAVYICIAPVDGLVNSIVVAPVKSKSKFI